jgi:putative sigma-54 modulation protein
MERPIEFFIRGARGEGVQTMREYAMRRLSFALRRVEHRIQRVVVRIVDLNGPKRGIDSRCSIAVELADGRHVFVDATTAWPFASITLAAARLGAAIGHEVERKAASVRRRPVR